MDGRTYSVLLGRFVNAGLDVIVTLAQVFWMRESHQGQPDRFYVVADATLAWPGTSPTSATTSRRCAAGCASAEPRCTTTTPSTAGT